MDELTHNQPTPHRSVPPPSAPPSELPSKKRHERQPLLRGTILLLLSIYLLWTVVGVQSIDYIPLLTTYITIAQGFFSFGLHQMEPFCTDWLKLFFRTMDFVCIPIQMSMVFFSYLNVSRHYYYNPWIVASEIFFVSLSLCQLITSDATYFTHLRYACIFLLCIGCMLRRYLYLCWR